VVQSSTQDPAAPERPPRAPVRQRLRRLWGVLPEVYAIVWPQRWILLIGLGLMLINRLASLVLPGATKFLIDDVVLRREPGLLYVLALTVGGAAVVQALTSFALVQVVSRAAQKVIAQLRIRIQQHVLRLPVSYYDSHKSGELISRILNDVEGVRNLIGTGMIDFIGGLFTAAVALLLLFTINTRLTLISLGFLLLFVVVIRYAFATLRPIYRRRSEILAEVSGRLGESLSGVRVVKTYNTERRETRAFVRGVHKLLRNVTQTLTTLGLISLSGTGLLGVVGVTVMLVGGQLMLSDRMTVGDFFAYTLYLGFLAGPVFTIVSIGSQLSEALAGLDRMREVLSVPREDESDAGRRPVQKVQGRVEFEAVQFAYDSGPPVLQGIGFVAEPGTVTALVGPSGAGKSTIIGLVAGFYRPTAGRVLIDGRDLAELRLRDYRKFLGAVLQDSFLFDGTIRENIAYARTQASAAEVEAAARIARCDEFAAKFELGLDTVVGERGVKLSGGQRQRVSIARAILADPRILILDEATSSLDSESEAAIRAGLSALMRERTTFVIAHRLSTVRGADTILVLEDGCIVERGTHSELLALRGRYHEMYTRQHSLEEDRFLYPGEEARAEPAAGPESEPKSKEAQPPLVGVALGQRSG